MSRLSKEQKAKQFDVIEYHNKVLNVEIDAIRSKISKLENDRVEFNKNWEELVKLNSEYKKLIEEYRHNFELLKESCVSTLARIISLSPNALADEILRNNFDLLKKQKENLNANDKNI